MGEEDRLTADREVTALGPADVVLGHQDPPQVRMAAEDDPEEVVGLALLELRCRIEGDAGIELGKVLDLEGAIRTAGGGVGKQRLDVQALHALAAEELVVDGEARGRREVVGGVDAGKEAVALVGGLTEPGERVQDALRVDDQRRAVVLDRGLDDRSLPPLLDRLSDELKSWSVRHPRAP